jgi:hypothetical protein
VTRTSLVCMGMFLCAAVAYAEPPATVNPLQDLPPDVQAKMSRLTEILAEAQQSGRLSDAQVHTALNSGDAPALIRGLGPEAARLLQEIAAGLKGKYTESELSMILGGLAGAK